MDEDAAALEPETLKPIEPETLDPADAAAPPIAARDGGEEEAERETSPQPPPAPGRPNEAQPPLVLQETNAKLPNNYFRAAGDPDELPEEPDTSFAFRLSQIWTQFRAFAEPKYVAFIGAARAFGREAWARLRGVRHPRSVREAAVWTGWVAAGFVALVVGFFFFVTWDMPSTDDLWEARGGQSITFLDRSGHVILREGAQNAPPVDLAALPPYVPQAFVAIEDRRFYQHFGVDLGGMMRAGAENMRAGHVVQGGSTITQQLAKNLFLSNERSWRRKLQEVAMAIWLETKFTKQEILALYLSRVYFGAGAYGIEAAAERYFDRPAHDLTLLQSAMLAGLVKAPSRLNPASQDMAAARARADTVLQEMVNIGYITEAQRRAALQEELLVSRRNPAGVLSYYRDWVDPELNRIIGTQRDDFIVETTIDIAAQRAANDSVNSVLTEQGQTRHAGEAGLLAMDDAGGVRAMIGGRDYEITQFNRTTQAHRQPGSSFKFFIYLAAMENGLTPWSVREDAPVVVYIPGQPAWTPGNYGDRYHGAVSLTEALAEFLQYGRHSPDPRNRRPARHRRRAPARHHHALAQLPFAWLRRPGGHPLLPRRKATCIPLSCSQRWPCSRFLAVMWGTPITPSVSWRPASGDHPVWSLTVLLAVSAGLPYFVLSSTGPLLQSWFTRTHPGRTPYRLYSLSNLGSLLGLLTYPFLVEPWFSLRTQARIWTIGFFVFAVVCGYCALRMRKI